MDDIHVAIRSFGRAGRVRTLEVAPFAHVWVPESQGDEYRRHYGDRIITIPDECDGNLGRKQNAILDRSPCKWTLILDDDISRIGMWEGGAQYTVEPDRLQSIILAGFLLAEQFGVRLWGINLNSDPLGYYTYRPFNLLAPVLGPFVGHLEPGLRYDESVLGKDDYDFWLQNIRAYRKTLRINRYFYVHDHGKMPGGFVSQRTKETELAGIERMRKKWGTKIYRPGGMSGGASAKGKNYLNSKVSVPIAGC